MRKDTLSDIAGEITREVVKTPFKIMGAAFKGLSDIIFGDDWV